MIKLYGFPLSNYFNKVKFVLLEHDIPFEEVRASFGQDEATLARSPLGKVPYIETDAGPLCESQVIVEYLASAYPDKPIFAADPYAGRQGARTGGVHRPASGTRRARSVQAGVLRRHRHRLHEIARRKAA